MSEADGRGDASNDAKSGKAEAIAGFTHADAGTAEHSWLTADGWARTAPLPLPEPPHRLLLVAAHPDDETLGAGGLLHLAARAGWTIRVVIATDGASSHPDSPTHSPARLAQLREAEVAHAVSLLAPAATVAQLRLTDGDLAASTGALAEALVDLLLPDGPASSWVVCPWSADRHPDHAAAAAAARIAVDRLTDLSGSRVEVRLLEYPVWAWSWATPDEFPWEQVRVLALPVDAIRDKNAAIDAHTTQVRPLSDEPGDEVLLHEGMLAHFRRDREAFVETT